MSINTGYALFGGYPCCEPNVEYEYQLKHGYDVFKWIYLANSFTSTLGPTVGRGYILLLRKYLDLLDINTLYDLEFGVIDENGNTTNDTNSNTVVLIKKLVIIKATNLTPAEPNSQESCYLVEIADQCYLAQNKPIDIQINMKAPDSPDLYYTESLNNGQPYTWDTAVQAIWNANSTLNQYPYPHLPYTPAGTPEEFYFIGRDSFEVLNILLSKVHCALQLLTNGTFNIVQLGIDGPLNQEESNYQDYLIHDGEILESVRAKIFNKVRVYFSKRSLYYGQEQVGFETQNFISNATYAIDVINPNISGTEAGNALIMWDDMTAEVAQDGSIDNLVALQSKANDIANAYYTSVQNSENRLHKVYSGIADVFPSGTLKAVIWHNKIRTGKDNSGGFITELISMPGFYDPQHKDSVGIYKDLPRAQNLLPPNFSQHTYPYWFPQIQYLTLDTGNPTIGVYSATLNIDNPETLGNVSMGSVWTVLDPSIGHSTLGTASFTAGMNLFGKIIGKKTIAGNTRPLYLSYAPFLSGSGSYTINSSNLTFNSSSISYNSSSISYNSSSISYNTSILNLSNNTALNVSNNSSITVTGTLDVSGGTVIGGNSGKDLFYWRQVSPINSNVMGDTETWYYAGITNTYAGGIYANNVEMTSDSGNWYILAVPFVTTRGGTLDRIGVGLTLGQASDSSIRLGIYNATSDTNLYPGSLVYDSGDIVISHLLNGVQNPPFPITATPMGITLTASKLYWFTLIGNNTTAYSAIIAGQAGVWGILGYRDLSAAIAGIGMYVNIPYGALPNNFPIDAVLIDSGPNDTIFTGLAPAIAVRFSA